MSALFNRTPNRSVRAPLLILSAVAGLLSAGAASACDLSISRAPSPVRIDYDPFDVVPAAPGDLDLELTNASDVECRVQLMFTDLADIPTPRLTAGEASLVLRPRETSGLRRTELTTFTYALTIPAQGRASAQFDVAVGESVVIAPGAYPVQLRLAVLGSEGQPLLASIPVDISVVSPARAQLNIAGAAGAYGSGTSVETIDFGEAETGAVRRAYLQIRANTHSTVTFDSEHRGRLASKTLVGPPVYIGYEVALDGAAVPLDRVTRLPVDPPRTLEGMSLPLVFTLGQVRGAMAGAYNDLLTITVSPD